MDENERSEKQKFLRTEIINRGYDAESFVLFLETKKLGSFEIDNFTMEELTKVE